jgi:hypothetical protein
MKKTIFIHVGPPKTGTSVIQSWLNLNNEHLSKYADIYYPAHITDENQVSSGHNRLILEREKDGKSTFSHQKFKELLKTFKAKNESNLLLSSEYFFYQIPSFFEYSNQYNIIFIAYIRPEFEFIESIYNQSVKRNGQSQPMAIRTTINNTYLNTVLDFIERFGNEFFILRAFGSRNFFSQNIISDFLSLFDSIDLNRFAINAPRINTSYSFDSLEFKRWTNSFALDDLDSVLDKKLQSYQGSNFDYTLIPLNTYNDYKIQSVKKISLINSKCPIYNYDKLIEYINLTSRPAYMHQELYDSHLIKIVRFLCNDDLAFCNRLYRSLISKPGISEIDIQRLKIFHLEMSNHQNKSNRFFSFFKKIWK